jgi:predicted RNase H-like HicB family nuclease
MYKYAIEIFFNDEDEGYIAIVPELPECSAFGETDEEALKEIKVAIELWMETSKDMRKDKLAFRVFPHKILSTINHKQNTQKQ